MTEEKCANCRHIRKLYVPPIHKDIPKDAYVCALFGIDETKMLYGDEEKQVMYLSDAEGMCEMFSPKKQEHYGCVGCTYEDSKNMSKCGVCSMNYRNMWESRK